jgi:hypothetical protein
MELKCKATGRFLANINIEEYFTALKKMGIEINIPIKIEIPCAKCKMVEVYYIYPNNYEKYEHISSYKFLKK